MYDAREETKQKIEVMQAFVDGKPIRARRKTTGQWYQKSWYQWNWNDMEYEVVPEPREIWVNEYEGVGLYGIQHNTLQEAKNAASAGYTRTIHFREVIDDE